MAEYNNLQSLVKVSTEVEESQTKLDLVKFCIKAQQDLTNKLHKEAQRRKETCNFIRNNNLQLESEIRIAQTEINSMLAAYETIRSANVEMKKELLLSEHSNMELMERMAEGENRYEELWLEAKKRFESIPFVQKWLLAKKQAETLHRNINAYENEAKIFQLEIRKRKIALQENDTKTIIALANFLIHERPAKLKIVKTKVAEIVTLVKDIDSLSIRKLSKPKILVPSENVPLVPKIDDQWPNLEREVNTDDLLMMPRLQLVNAEVDVLNTRLELNKLINLQNPSLKRTEDVVHIDKSTKIPKTEDKQCKDFYISAYFNKPLTTMQYNINDSKEEAENYSRKKLINILDDVKIDKNEVFDIVSKVDPIQLMEVSVIAAESSKSDDITRSQKNKVAGPIESEEIEEVDLTQMKSQNILEPPTQFIDLTQENMVQNSQHVEVIVHVSLDTTPVESEGNTLTGTNNEENTNKKKVSFDIPMSVDDTSEAADDNDNCDTANVTNETVASQLDGDVSCVTDDNFMQIKDMILKKHHLDLSPQFIYTKNNLLQKRTDNDQIVTSKFFNKTNEVTSEDVQPSKSSPDNVGDNDFEDAHTQSRNINEKVVENQVNPVQEAFIEERMASPKEANESGPSVAGLLFTHGPQGIPDSLDISMSTTGFDDGDTEFPHCLDSSLLLSPKADIQTESANGERASQELPNFLTGFRKTGLFFFGQGPSKEGSGNDSNTQAPQGNQDNNFNFNFGSQEKKNRGLFSFFR